MSIVQDAELLTSAAAAVYGTDHLLKATDPHEDATKEMAKAAIAAAVAVGAFELVRRAEAKGDTDYYRRSRSWLPDNRSRERSKSHDASGHSSGEVRHHKAHFAEELIGAYALGKELLGDKKHHVGYMVAEAIGGLGGFQELRGRDRIEDEERRRERERSVSRGRYITGD